jgi:hypothetical protein
MPLSMKLGVLFWRHSQTLPNPVAGCIRQSGPWPAGVISGTFYDALPMALPDSAVDYTSAEGLHHLQLLYQELQVPLDAMVVGLEGIKQASLKRLDSPPPELETYFDHLITQLKQFR